MRWLIPLLLLLEVSVTAHAGVTVLHADAYGVDLEIRTPLRFDTVAAEMGSRIRLVVEDWPRTVAPGMPEIPYLVVPLVVPLIGGVQAMVVSQDDTSARIGPVTVAAGDQPLGIEDEPDLPAASVPDLPVAPVSVELVGIARDVRMARLVVRPVEYLEGTVRWAQRMHVVLRFTSPPVARPARVARNPSPDHPAAFAINGAEIDAFRLPRPPLPRARVSSYSAGPKLRFLINGDPAFEGIYRVTGKQLVEWGRRFGIDFSTVDPQTFRLEHLGQEVPVYVEGQERRVTDETFAIEFFARPNLQRFQSVAADLYRDPFVDAGVYLLSWGGGYGARMAEEDGSLIVSPEDPDFVECLTYRYTVHAEQDNFFDRIGGSASLGTISPNLVDRYFWAGVSAGVAGNFTVGLEHPAQPLNYDIDAPVVEVMGRGQSFRGHIVDFSLNDGSIGSVGRDSVVRDVDLIHFKGFGPKDLGDGPGVVRIETGDRDPASGDNINLNWIEITYNRLYEATNNYISFHRPTKPASGTFDFTITGFTSQDVTIYKVGVSRLTNLTIRQKPRGITPEPGSYQVRFQDRLDGDDPEYIALTSARKLTPQRVEFVPAWPQPLKDPSRQGEYLIIAHPMLVDTVQRLANYRRSEQGGGFSVAVVSALQVYDEFDYGYPTPYAIRDFIRYAVQYWSVPPQYVLLVGDGVLKFTDKWLNSPVALLPAFGETVVKWGLTGSDYGYTLVQDDDMLPDLYLGRIPAPDNTTLRGVIDKIVAFEQSPSLDTPWRNAVLLVSEGERRFAIQNESLSGELPVCYARRKVYSGDIPYDYLTPFSGGQRETLDQLNRGSLWTIYLGHGGGGVWGSERLLTHEHPQILTNTGRTGIFLSMTCFTGAFDNPDPDVKSLSELMLFAKGGAIAWWGSSGLGWVENDFFIAQSVVRVGLLSRNARETVGAAVTGGKIDYLMRYGGPNPPRGSFPHSIVYLYNLIGDPALRISPPKPSIGLELSTRTPLPGDAVAVNGTIPEPTATGKAWLALYDDRELQVFPPEGTLPLETPVAHGSFQVNVTVPTSLWGTGLTLKAYASSTQPSGRDWAGYARLSVAETLVDSVVISRRSRDSIFVSATVYSAEQVKAVACSVVVSSDGQADQVVPMAAVGGSNRYRTTAPLDVSHLPPGDPDAFIRPIILVTDQLDRVTMRGDIPPIYPNATSQLRLGAVELTGTARAELTGAVTNEGQIASDSVVARAWLLRNDVPVRLLHEVHLTPLAPLSENTTPINETELVPKVARGSDTAEATAGGAAFLPQRARLAIPLPDSLIRGERPGAVILVVARSADGRSEADSARFEVPPNVVSYDPGIASPRTLSSPSGQFHLEIEQGALSGPALVRVDARSAPTQSGQPDLNVPGAKAGHPIAACEVRWLAPVEVTSTESISLTFAIDQNDTNLQRALALSQLRVGYWNADRRQWEVISVTQHTWAPDNSSVTVQIARQGVYAFVQVDDQLGPTIEISASGQQFGEGAYVNELTKFLVLVEDRNGVSSVRGDLRAWIDDVPLPDSAVSLPTHTTSVTAVPFTLTSPPLTPREEPYVLRVEAHDAVGNVSSEEVSFQVAQQAALEFYGNFPNPFGADGTILAFEFTRQMREVLFRIYDVSGRQVLRFSNYDLSQLYPDDPPEQHRATSPSQLLDRLGIRLFAIDYHELHWSGRGADGQPLANGVYFCIVTARDDDTGQLVAEHTFTMVKAE